MEGKEEKSDVLIVAHGHILRAFAMRWIGRQLTSGVSLLLEGDTLYSNSFDQELIQWYSWWRWYVEVGVDYSESMKERADLNSYEHHNIEEPAILQVTSFN